MSPGTITARKGHAVKEDHPASPKSPSPPTTTGIAGHVHRVNTGSSLPLEKQGLDIEQPQPQPQLGRLVDKDFRSRFVERRLQAQRLMEVSLTSSVGGGVGSEPTGQHGQEINSSTTPKGTVSPDSTLNLDDVAGPRAFALATHQAFSTVPDTESAPVSPQAVSPGEVDQGRVDAASSLPASSLPASAPQRRSQLSHLIEQSRGRHRPGGLAKGE